MLNIFKKNLFLFVVLVFASGCAGNKAVIEDSQHQKVPVEKPKTIFSLEPSDKDIYFDGLAYLSNQQGDPNYTVAKTKLESLIQKYPKSKWTTSAQVLIKSIDRIIALQGKIMSEKQKAQTEKAKMHKENEVSKEDLKLVEEKYSAEIVRLQQENEKLKNDIKLLKQLEVQLEKREKMLR